MDKTARSQISRCASRPEITHELLVCATEDGIGLVALVDPSIRMLVKEYREVGNMTEALKAGIEITCVAEIRETDLALFRVVVLRCHWGYNYA
jgi:hypothetical protein